MLNIAVRAARNAGDLIQRSSNNIEKLTIDQKSRNDYASEVDRMAEQDLGVDEVAGAAEVDERHERVARLLCRPGRPSFCLSLLAHSGNDAARPREVARIPTTSRTSS